MWRKAAESGLLTTLLFAAGSALGLGFSYYQLAPIWPKYRLIPTIVSSQTETLQYSCRDADCVRCLSGLASSPQGLVMTSGSSFRTGLDLKALSSAMPFPIVDCMRNDSRVDAYSLFLSHASATQPGQTIFHGYNSWSINSPGTWRDATAESFFNTRGATSARRNSPSFSDIAQQYRLLANIFVVTTLSASSTEWRVALRHRIPLVDRWQAPYWPLTRDEHLRRRLRLMKRWFELSPYVHSFVVESERMRPPEEIAGRHEAFMQAAAPAARFIFAPSPELTEVFPARLQKVITESRAVFMDTLARHPAALHLDVDYRACGIEAEDFWSENHMAFDVAHPGEPARPKITRCLVDAFQRLEIARVVAGH